REVVEATDAVYSHCGARRSGGHCQWTGDVTPLEILGVDMAGLVATQDWLVRHGYDEPGYHVAAVLAAGMDIEHARQELGMGEYIPTALETLRAEWPHRRAAVQRVAQACSRGDASASRSSPSSSPRPSRTRPPPPPHHPLVRPTPLGRPPHTPQEVPLCPSMDCAPRWPRSPVV